LTPPIEETAYYPFAGERVAMRRDGDLTYLHRNHLGSTAMTSNAAGQVVSTTRFRPFGTERWSDGPVETDLQFAGERAHDGMDQVHEMGVRFYDPGYYTWLSADSMIPDVNSTMGLNRYTYVGGNPVGYVDPSGHCGERAQPWWATVWNVFDKTEGVVNSSAPVISATDKVVNGGYRYWDVAMKHSTDAEFIPGWMGDAVNGVNWTFQASSILVHSDAAGGPHNGSLTLLNSLALGGEIGFDVGTDYLATALSPHTAGASYAIVIAKDTGGLLSLIPGMPLGDPTVAFGQAAAIIVGTVVNPTGIGRATFEVFFGPAGEVILVPEGEVEYGPLAPVPTAAPTPMAPTPTPTPETTPTPTPVSTPTSPNG
ncbi:MAG: RHS repeat-associated core domain-containing protein, partial [Acidobacteriota bacterium]